MLICPSALKNTQLSSLLSAFVVVLIYNFDLTDISALALEFRCHVHLYKENQQDFLFSEKIVYVLIEVFLFQMSFQSRGINLIIVFLFSI